MATGFQECIVVLTNSLNRKDEELRELREKIQKLEKEMVMLVNLKMFTKDNWRKHTFSFDHRKETGRNVAHTHVIHYSNPL